MQNSPASNIVCDMERFGFDLELQVMPVWNSGGIQAKELPRAIKIARIPIATLRTIFPHIYDLLTPDQRSKFASAIGRLKERSSDDCFMDR